MQSTPELHRNIVMALLEITHTILVKHNIQYIIEGGTLLGAVREGDMISHDDDADICVWKDWHKLKGILHEFKELVIGFDGQQYKVDFQESSSCMIKIYVPGLWVTLPATESLPERIIGTPTLDIFRRKMLGGKLRLYSRDECKRFPNCWALEDEVFPLKQYKLSSCHTFVHGPNIPEPFLQRYYGDDCLRVVRYDNRVPEAPLMKKTIEI